MQNHEQLFVSIRKIIRAIDIRSRKLGKEAGITGPQLMVLQEILQRDGITAREVASRINLSQATVTNILDRLEIKLFVERKRSDIDKRRVALHLTEDGKTALSNAPQAIEEQFVERFSALKDWEQLQLMAAVEKIADMMDASDIEAAPVLNIGELESAPK
ncbi:MarR family winged helix-turn-helix transcriptional regulator [Agaribacter flavus]|uniref:MarR family winged helix-turn-helix transcriptional regulator n=1 Tax=Agaribacter flavus TaxID=1902781 RepID=A0ABV7FTB9_9ALTE